MKIQSFVIVIQFQLNMDTILVTAWFRTYMMYPSWWIRKENLRITTVPLLFYGIPLGHVWHILFQWLALLPNINTIPSTRKIMTIEREKYVRKIIQCNTFLHGENCYNFTSDNFELNCFYISSPIPPIKLQLCKSIFCTKFPIRISRTRSKFGTVQNGVNNSILNELHLCDTPVFVRALTHWGRVTHICASKPYHHWVRHWLVAWTAPSHYLNECWYIVNWTLRKKCQWNINRNSNIFIQENAFVRVVCEISAILSRSKCVKIFSFMRYKRSQMTLNFTGKIKLVHK